MNPDTLDQIAMMIGRLHEQRNILMNEIERLLNSHQHGSEYRPCREANRVLAEVQRLKQK
jgi:hypothetical protein